jgi:hypothetical protein
MCTCGMHRRSSELYYKVIECGLLVLHVLLAVCLLRGLCRWNTVLGATEKDINTRGSKSWYAYA